MLAGQYFHQIDEKNRLRIPAKLRAVIGSDYIVTRGTSGCLFIYDKQVFEKSIYEKLAAVPLSDTDAQKPLRNIMRYVFDVEEDKQGRFVLPLNLKEIGDITKDVVFIGMVDKIELWSKERFDKYFEEDDLDQTVKNLKEYGV